jgi:putative ABC transport system permease protein
MLGVIFGVAAVIVMVAIVEGARAEVLEQFESLGSDLIMLWYSPERERGRVTHVEGLTIEDARAIGEQAYLVKAVSPEARSPGDQLIEYGDREVEAAVFGVEHTCRLVRNIEIGEGRFINADDDKRWAKVCVLGAEMPMELFGGRPPLGREITVMGLRATVVGVLKKKGQAFGEDIDRRVYLPLSTFQKRITGDTNLATIFAKAADQRNVEAGADQIWEILMRRHDNQPDFMVDTQGRLLSAIETVISVFRIVLGCVAGLSLLVGGIGIMNIMLVSVTERTREIGVRKAVGAKRRHIWFQFLTEAAALSGVGGLLGIVTGVVMSWLVGKYAGEQLPTSVPVWACVMGFAFAVGVGIFFGMYPAVRAARLDPIAALHYE